MSKKVRVRFAPSPTGFLHIGGVRTALFNWLYAKRYGGQFLLRIEDTDLERSEERFTQDIMTSMKWLGLNWDEEPIFQSQRLDVYRQKAQELMDRGLAYKCYCSEQDLEGMRARAMTEGKKPMYDRTCREGREAPSTEAPYVIRAKLPLDGEVAFDDLIRGRITVQNQELDDFVLVRSNGAPTYNFSVVVDDVFSQMTHVIRGDDHINNTPKQVHLYLMFAYPQPGFAHLPMILGSDKKKLSKRHGAVSANWYRSEGYLPEALLNFLARLGWSHGDQEVFSIREMCDFFSFESVQKSSAVFNSEKLLWVNGEHIRKASVDRLSEIIRDDFADYFKEPAQLARVGTPLGKKIVGLLQPKVKLLKEMAEQMVPLCTPGAIEVDPSPLKWNKDPALKTVIQGAIRAVLQEWEKKAEISAGFAATASESWGNAPSLEHLEMGPVEIEAFLKQVSEQHGVKLGDLIQPLRLCMTGRTSGPSLFELIAWLPVDVLLPRMRKSLEI